MRVGVCADVQNRRHRDWFHGIAADFTVVESSLEPPCSLVRVVFKLLATCCLFYYVTQKNLIQLKMACANKTNYFDNVTSTTR